MSRNKSLRYFFTHNHRRYLWIVKNIEQPKRTISFPKKGDGHSFHFQGGFPPILQPRTGQASPQGGVKGREQELEISLLAIANFKNLWKITIWTEEFFQEF